MKNIILFILLISFGVSYGQSLKDKLKECSEEMYSLKIRNNDLVLDSIKTSIKIKKSNRDYDLRVRQLGYTIDSLKWVYKKDIPKLALFDTLKKQIYTLSTNGVILYQRNGEDIFYIDLSCYDLIEYSNDEVRLIPIKDPARYHKIEMPNGYPQRDNLSLHFYPHDIDGSKLKY